MGLKDAIAERLNFKRKKHGSESSEHEEAITEVRNEKKERLEELAKTVSLMAENLCRQGLLRKKGNTLEIVTDRSSIDISDKEHSLHRSFDIWLDPNSKETNSVILHISGHYYAKNGDAVTEFVFPHPLKFTIHLVGEYLVAELKSEVSFAMRNVDLDGKKTAHKFYHMYAYVSGGELDEYKKNESRMPSDIFEQVMTILKIINKAILDGKSTDIRRMIEQQKKRR